MPDNPKLFLTTQGESVIETAQEYSDLVTPKIKRGQAIDREDVQNIYENVKIAMEAQSRLKSLLKSLKIIRWKGK